MPHLVLTGALLFALLAIVATAIGACIRIARDLMLDGAEDESDGEPAVSEGGRISLSKDFGVGLRNATTFAQTRGGPFQGGGSREA
jgi:hypothetical protein